MKIKTVVRYDPVNFDDLVNEALERGYQLEHRGLMPPNREGETLHYAQLVLPDPPAKDKGFDALQALYQVQKFCQSVDQNDCGTDRCPLNGWCQRLRDCADPTDWDLTEEVPF